MGGISVAILAARPQERIDWCTGSFQHLHRLIVGGDDPLDPWVTGFEPPGRPCVPDTSTPVVNFRVGMSYA